jgi:hypothetical protein
MKIMKYNESYSKPCKQNPYIDTEVIAIDASFV